MAFWKKWTKKEKPTDEWEELSLEMKQSAEEKPIDKNVLNAICGKSAPLEAKVVLEDFVREDWEKLKPHYVKMAKGSIPAAPWVLEILFRAYPRECGDLLLPHAQEMPVKSRLALFSVIGEAHKDDVTKALVADLKTFDAEELGSALRILALYPTEQGKAATAGLLCHEDWRIAMKAASALGEAHAIEYLPQLREAAAREGILGTGVEKIIKELES